MARARGEADGPGPISGRGTSVQAAPWSVRGSSEGPRLLLPALPIPAALQEHPSQALLQGHLPHEIRCAFSIPVRRAQIQKQEQGRGETGALVQCGWERKMVQLLRKTVWRLLRTEHGSTMGPAIPLPGTCPEEGRGGRHSHLLVHSSHSVEASRVHGQKKE